MKRKFRIAATIFFVILVVGAIVAGALFVPKKEFSVPSVAIEAVIDTDGTVRVVEHITYDFTGQFSFGTRPVPVGNYSITDMRVSENGVELASSGAPYNLTWYFDAENETRTFDISYAVTGAVVAGSDVAAFYWKWVGDDHPTIGEVTAELAVPPGPGKLHAWGHGPLTGTVEVAADSVRWQAPDVARGRFVEGRVTIPVTRLPQLPAGGEPQLERIRAEEAEWARAANDARRDAARTARLQRQVRTALTVGIPVLIALAFGGFLLIWRRFGREPTISPEVGEYHRELPDDPPAVVAGLMEWGTIGPDAFAATVLDLAQRGFLTVEEVRVDRALLPDKVDYEITRTDADDSTLLEFERTVLAQVFAGGSPVRQSEMAGIARAHQAESQARWNSFKADAATSLRNRGYINGERSRPFLLNIGLAIVLGLAGAGALALRAWVVGGIGIAAAAVLLALTPLLRQRSVEGQTRYVQWRGVANYLRDFSQLGEAPVGHLVLWERYLVYAVALGVSEELGEGLALRLPPEQRATFAPWYIGHPGSTMGASFASFGSFASGLSASTVAFTPPSSSSGGGGGFSGGGGGGGGGGGIGAG